jgi:hypothetical protein
MNSASRYVWFMRPVLVCRAVALTLNRATKSSGCYDTVPASIAPYRNAARWFRRRSRTGNRVSGRGPFAVTFSTGLTVPVCSYSSPYIAAKSICLQLPQLPAYYEKLDCDACMLQPPVSVMLNDTPEFVAVAL